MEVRVATLNVQGLSLKGKPHAHKIWNLLKLMKTENVDILALQETFFKSNGLNLEVSKMLENSGCVWHGHARSTLKRKDFKGSGGVAFIVRGDVGEVKVETGCNGLQWLEVRNERKEVTLVVANVYLVPASSTRALDNERVEAELEKQVMVWKSVTERIIVVGDGNGRAGETPAVQRAGANSDGSDASEEEEEEWERKSRDKKVNERGRSLLGLVWCL